MRQPLSITAISRAFSRPRRLINTARRMLAPAQPDAFEPGAQARHRQLELVARSGHYEIVVDHDTKEHSHSWSQGMFNLLGLADHSAALSLDAYMTHLVQEHDRNRVRAFFENALQGAGQCWCEYTIVRPDGTRAQVYDWLQADPAVHGKRIVYGFRLDISDRHKKMIVGLDSLREQEQRRLAKDIHDDFGQLLAALKMDMGVLESQLPGGDYRLAQLVCSIQRLLDTMMTSVRRIIADLPPQDLDNNGLVAALRSLTTSFAKRHQVACELALPDHELALDATIAAPLYRLVQEALNNVAKHAQATRVNIRLGCRDRQVVLSVADNGAGFTGAALQKEGSFGVTGMRERIAALGGDFAIDSAPGKGTHLHIAIPLDPQSNPHAQ